MVTEQSGGGSGMLIQDSQSLKFGIHTLRFIELEEILLKLWQKHSWEILY